MTLHDRAMSSWNRETVDSRCVLARENRGSFLAVYIARVRITEGRRMSALCQ